MFRELFPSWNMYTYTLLLMSLTDVMGLATLIVRSIAPEVKYLLTRTLDLPVIVAGE